MPQDISKPEPSEAPKNNELITLTSDVVAAYVGNNAVTTSDLPNLIGSVYGMLSSLGTPAESEGEQKPAVPIKRSVTNASIVCLECGKGQKMLKRHLASAHGLTPEEYRAKWRLPYDYPMVAPDYAEKRRSLAKQIGLGRKPAATKKAAAKKAPAKRAPAKRRASSQKKN